MFKSHLHDEDRDGDDDHHDDVDVHQSPSRLPVNLTTLAQGSVVTVAAVPQLAILLPAWIPGQTPKTRPLLPIKKKGHQFRFQVHGRYT